MTIVLVMCSLMFISPWYAILFCFDLKWSFVWLHYETESNWFAQINALKSLHASYIASYRLFPYPVYQIFFNHSSVMFEYPFIFFTLYLLIFPYKIIFTLPSSSILYISSHAISERYCIPIVIFTFHWGNMHKRAKE